MPESSTEYIQIERPLIEQLSRMGWRHIEGDIEVPDATERRSFRDVLLLPRLRAALRSINLDDGGQPWLNESRINQAVGALEQLGVPKLLEANKRATELLLRGTSVEGDPAHQDGKGRIVYFIDFEHPERNDFLVVSQFRVDLPGGQGHIIPDAVLFVNGIPLVVVECKSPAATNPIEEGITQLLRYSNQRHWVAVDEGVEQLFHYNQLLVAMSGFLARVGTVGAQYEHYLEWKDTGPVARAQVAAELGVNTLTGQQTLVAGMLRPAQLLDLVRHFTLFRQSGGALVKIVARYQQFRAVQAALHRLRTGQTRVRPGERDQRGGIIWHTQGSGKSLTMVFLVRKLRGDPQLRRFKVVVVTDRGDLEKQIGATAALTGATVRRAISAERLKTILREGGSDLVFAMIQKYHERDDDDEVVETALLPELRKAAKTRATYATGKEPARLVAATETFATLNTSADILVLVDEAHRVQASAMHANLLQALPNSARISVTGTPVLAADRRRTSEIFGDFIDRYTIKQSQDDGATVPILYEGRTADARAADGRAQGQLFEDMFHERTPADLDAVKRKYSTEGNVLEAPKLVAAKAADMLRHYVATVLPDGMKAQVVASSRRAAVLYQVALAVAQRNLIAQLEALDPALLNLSQANLERRDAEMQFLVRAHAHLNTIRRLEFAAIISGATNDETDQAPWKAKQDMLIERFKKPLVADDPARQDGLAFLCVKNMLLTGFDVPVEQVLYLDRFMQGHELLQAIARVNRTYGAKQHGLVVDYYGVARHLTQALAVYSAEDVEGALTSIGDELTALSARHRRALAVFHDQGIADIADITACVQLLRDVKIRAAFSAALKQFLESLNIILPRPEALPHLRDAKILGFINKAAAIHYRDSQLNLLGVGRKVRDLIDEYIIANGIDPRTPPNET
ncbi:MAG: type I restriction endonuclease subunit R [Roseiflexaceae bacterium]